MYSEVEPTYAFTPDMVDRLARIWTRSAITLIDVRCNDRSPEQPLIDYRMPSGMLIYTYGGPSNVQMNDAVFGVDRFGIFHGGKGTRLDIYPLAGKISVFMVFYKAEPPSARKKDLQRMLEEDNPFMHLFGYTPDNPIKLMDMFQQMMHSWQLAAPLEQLQAKALLYQSMREIYNDLYRGETRFFQPDPVLSTRRYLDEQYMNPVLFEDIADMFAISRGQLTRLFKKKTGMSLQHYLTLKRLEAAGHRLLHTDATVKEIATGCGLTEELNLIRLFKKHYRMTPSEFRKKMIVPMHDYDIDNDYHRLYNEKGLANLVKTQRDGELTMFGQIRGKEMIVAAAMSLMLFLSACGSNAPANNGGTPSQTPAQTQQAEGQQATATPNAQSEAQAEGSTRVVQTVKGDVEVPTNPQRIIATYGIGDLVALGARLAATYDVAGTAFADEVAELPVWNEFAGEEIMAFDPDLIFVVSEEQYEEVSKIAPTILVPFTQLSMEERVTFLGEVLGKQEEARQLLSDFNAKISEAQKTLQEKGILSQTFSLLERGSNGVWVYGDKWGRGGDLLYSHLGLKAPDIIQSEIIGKDQYREISMEVINDYVGDYIVFSGELGDLADHTVWNALPAVKEGRIIFIDFSLFFNIDIFSTNVQLDFMMDQFKAQ